MAQKRQQNNRAPRNSVIEGRNKRKERRSGADARNEIKARQSRVEAGSKREGDGQDRSF